MKKIKTILISKLLFFVTFVSVYAENQPQEQKAVVFQENIKGSTSVDNGVVDFEAKKALYYPDGSGLELREEVKFKTSEGVSLQTESLKWDKSKDLVSTNDDVFINKQDQQIDIKGTGMSAQPGMKEVKLENNVEVVMPQGEDNFVSITCDGPLEIKYNEGEAIFYNKVKVSQKDAELYSDTATVHFDGQNKKLKMIIAAGNVKIIRGKDISYSEKAIYYADEKRVVLEGRPRLVIFPENENGKSYDIADVIK